MIADLAARLRKLCDAYAADVIDADMYEAGLAKLRREYGADAVDQLLSTEAPAPAPASRSATVTGQVAHLFQGDIQGHVFINGRRGKEPAQLLAGYLQRLAARCAVLPLQGMREQRAASDTFDISLDRVYTQLATTRTVERDHFAGEALRGLDIRAYRAQQQQEDLLPFAQRTGLRAVVPSDHALGKRLSTALKEATEIDVGEGEALLGVHAWTTFDDRRLLEYRDAADALHFSGPELVTEAIAGSQRLVLLGEPGSGKSTALRYLARTLARAGLEEGFDPAAQLEGWAAVAGGTRLLPLFVPLLPFTQQLPAASARPVGAADLWNYLAARLESGGRFEGLTTAVHDELEAGTVLLMLDGLDEVAGDDSRRQVVAAVQAFAAEYPQCRIVVSCRVRAYEGERNREWQLPGWPTVTLADWTPAQMRHFARAWYAAIPELTEERRLARAESLERAIAVRPDLRRLGVRPLLMTIMALVHLNDQGQLPEGRVALYNRCVDLLLGQWELAREDGSDYGALMRFIKLPDLDVKALRPLLEDIALRAHSVADEERRGRVGANDLHMLVATFLETKGHPNPLDGARKFLDYTDVRAGLLQASDARDAYLFPHQTFQEYLAGRALVRDVEYIQRIMAVRDDDRWRVPILLGVGHVAGEGAMAMVSGLLAELIDLEGRTPDQEGRDLLLAAEIGADLGWATLEAGGAAFKRLKRDLVAGLVRHAEGTTLPAVERVRAGIIVGDLVDPRPGVCDLPPPFVRFAGGSFVIGISEAEYQAIIEAERTNNLAKEAENWYKDSRNDQAMTVAAFELARYPLTNAQFQLFIGADGYQLDAPWWDEAARGWLANKKVRAPGNWNDARLGSARPNHPIVGIHWYEATAFCKWLTQYRNDGYVYRLPSEAEWEYAARGAARRPYPWGEDLPDGERVNFNQTHGGTSAVGCFPAGATPEGLLDMAGNVWEWTRSGFRNYPYNPDDGRENGSNPAQKRFTIRGGSWGGRPFDLRAAVRGIVTPDSLNLDVGFRLARQRA